MTQHTTSTEPTQEQSTPGTPLTGIERATMTTREVATFLGKSKTAARWLLTQLEASGLHRKGRGRGTHYSKAEFLKAYGEYDTRP